MPIKSIIVSCYLLFAYWVSSHIPTLRMFFYPTLAAFGYFFISRTVTKKDIFKIIFAAIIASTLGSSLHFLDPGLITFFITCLLTICMIRIFKLNAAPILAVSLIPYFANLTSFWILPIAIFLSLGGLFVTLTVAQIIEPQ